MADAWQKDLPQGPLPDRSPHVIAAAIFALFFSTIAVLLRCISRKLSKASFWWDDWIIIISLVLSPHFLFLRLRLSNNGDVAFHMGACWPDARLGICRVGKAYLVTRRSA